MWSSLVASRSGGYPMLSQDPEECPQETDDQAGMTEAFGMPTAGQAANALFSACHCIVRGRDGRVRPGGCWRVWSGGESR
jgi:hypothetical protein